MENLFTYSPVSWDIVSQVLTFGVGAHLAALLYFCLTIGQVAPRYRLSNVLSGVVMISAALILFQQQQSWQNAFVFNGDVWERSNATFSNGYRYMNWTIDVPMLLTQLLIVAGFAGARFRRYWVQFVVAGLAMIYAGYVGQFYETTSTAQLYIWGTISTVFFLWILVIVWRVTHQSLPDLPDNAKGLMRGVFWLLFISWMLYPGAYLMPVIWFGEGGSVARLITFTVADVTSKVVYGVLLGYIALRRSKAEGFRPALTSEGETRNPAQYVNTEN